MRNNLVKPHSSHMFTADLITPFDFRIQYVVTTRFIIANNLEKIHLTQSMDEPKAELLYSLYYHWDRRGVLTKAIAALKKVVEVTIWIPRWANYLCSAAWKISSLLNWLCYQMKRIGPHSEGRIPPSKIVFAAIFQLSGRAASSQWGPLYMHLMKTKKTKTEHLLSFINEKPFY